MKQKQLQFSFERTNKKGYLNLLCENLKILVVEKMPPALYQVDECPETNFQKKKGKNCYEKKTEIIKKKIGTDLAQRKQDKKTK